MAENHLQREARLLAALEAELLAQTSTVVSIFVSPENSRAYECSQASCGRNAYASGLCNAHYIRKRNGADMARPLRARKREDKCAECGEITGAKGGWGLCQKHYRRKRSAAIKDALVREMGGRCEECENSYPRAAYDFHHLEDKDHSPGVLIGSGSLVRIAKEVAKCILLCANCHRIEHNEY